MLRDNSAPYVTSVAMVLTLQLVRSMHLQHWTNCNKSNAYQLLMPLAICDKQRCDSEVSSQHMFSQPPVGVVKTVITSCYAICCRTWQVANDVYVDPLRERGQTGRWASEPNGDLSFLYERYGVGWLNSHRASKTKPLLLIVIIYIQPLLPDGNFYIWNGKHKTSPSRRIILQESLPGDSNSSGPIAYIHLEVARLAMTGHLAEGVKDTA